MKKELLIASALTASFGLANVAEAGANVSYSGSVTRGVTQDDVGGAAASGHTAVTTGELSFAIDQTTDSGTKWSTSLSVVDEGSAEGDPGGLTLTFTDGSTLDLIEAGSAFGGAIASIPAAGGSQGITNTSTNSAPGDLDWADASDAVGFDWGSAADFGGIDGLTVGAGYGEVEQIHSEGNIDEQTIYATYAVGALTVGVQISEEDTGNSTGTVGYNNEFVGVTYQINDDFSVGFQAADNEHDKTGTDVTSEFRGWSAAYSMGALGVKFKRNEGRDINGTAATDDTSTEVSVSLAF